MKSAKQKHKNTKEYTKYNIDYMFKYKHKFERDDALIVLREQGGCYICKKELPEQGGHWYQDHDHNCCPKNSSCEKCRRGILCRECNLMLGLVKDNIEVLEKAIEYLRIHRDNREKENEHAK
jgi:hypothetical protein